MDIQIIEKSQFNQNLGDELRSLRNELGMSQEKFAEKADIARTYIGAIERGEKNISVYALYRILSAIGVSISDFMSRI